MSIVEEIKLHIARIDKDLEFPLNEKHRIYLIDLKRLYENRLSIMLNHEKMKKGTY